MSSVLPILLLLGPLVGSLAIFALPVGKEASRTVEIVHVAAIGFLLVMALAVGGVTLASGPVGAFGQWVYVDPLAAIFVGLVGVVGFLTGLYSLGYIRHDVEHGELTPFRHKLYYGFFNLFLFTMLLAVTANNIVMMWVAVEATTLGSAFLVGIYGKRSSLEAAWKYVIICTVGVAFGLYGTVLTFSNGSEVLADPHGAILWTTLFANAKALDPMLVKIAFVFVLIGFGTKAGIFPMHAWLPDAHSEAPSPVSALLSGVLLKCALFVIIRYYAITMQAVGPEFPQTLLLLLGFLSVAVSAFLFFVQQDLKRKLAYSSVEHIGLILLGLGFGGPLGLGAALLHAVNHSFAKALLFCGSGNVLMKYGSRDLGTVKGLLRVAPVSGVLMMAGALALAGFPPFNVFVSEFMVFNAGLGSGWIWLTIGAALLLTVTIAGFVQIISGSVLGKAPETMRKGDLGFATLAPMGLLMALVLIFGFAVPQPVTTLIGRAASVVAGGPATALEPPTPIYGIAPQLQLEARR
ncbi:hydrogenase 4 subunit F [Rhodovulum sp. PH10]|uniref:hydrogenase 4 subunit F n=1 Tax=Rhodovulum sp. PH10 TaxID=1187851 RepID=UPI00058EF7EB|nr:hydrogenase 4 subunit F [Rhodovulum sp. PH10]